jgi:hypothetical protein
MVGIRTILIEASIRISSAARAEIGNVLGTLLAETFLAVLIHFD